MKFVIISILFLLTLTSRSQANIKFSEVKPGVKFDNIYVLKIAEDTFHSTYIIWVKKNVQNHIHVEHTENIQILKGRALFEIDGKEINVKKGDALLISKGTEHAVLKVKSIRSLKIVSIQTPKFQESDRIYINPN